MTRFRSIPFFVSLLLVVNLTGPVRTYGQERKVWTNSLGMEFVHIPAGEFRMGTKLGGSAEELAAAFPASLDPRFALNEAPRHTVTLTNDFYLAVHEVTVEQFQQFSTATGHRTTAEQSGKGIVGFAPPTEQDVAKTGRIRAFQCNPIFTWKNPGFDQGGSHPVVGVSWEDAQAFCRWLSRKEGKTYRLPTEAEWEYACRAKTNTWFSFGDDFRGRIHKWANIANVELEKKHKGMAMRQWLLDVETESPDAFVYTAPVGRMSANPWGLHDMHGNVWEWCQDRYLENCYQKRHDTSGQQAAITDPLQLEKQDVHGDWRVIRGGSWCNGPLMCRSACRGFFDSTDAACYLGFRVVRE